MTYASSASSLNDVMTQTRLLHTDRRALLRVGAAVLAAPLVARSGLAFASSDPFTLGVASGDPSPDGFVIWTRLAPEPLAPDGRGGLTAPVPVSWEVAADEAFTRIVRRGRTTADPRLAHSVHVEVAGLAPGRPYWYRFSAQGARSASGRARTAPRPGDHLTQLKIAVASCSNYEVGYFSAYRHMAEEAPDVALFLGDYIYESSRTGPAAANIVRHHDRPGQISDLTGYRNRYALHRMDADLQALHHAAPAIMTWDDHEVQNDYSGQWSMSVSESVEDFRRRRAAAYQAFYEHMPLRRRSIPRGPDMRIYDRLRFGDLAEFHVLDGRQYRSIQPCPTETSRRGHVVTDACTERTDPARTMLGRTQEAWLHDGFRRASARWTVMAQDLLIAPLVQRDLAGVEGHYTDGWDGYPATRDRMLSALAAARTPNPVFLGGDIHSYWVTDLKADFRNPDSATVATEFVGTSITSDGPPYELAMAGLPQNPHVRFFDSRPRGYMSLTFTHDRLTTRLQTISDRRDPHATLSTLKTFVVEAGRPGAVEA